MCTKTKTINKFRDFVKENELIKNGDTLILGASGGPDSQFLIFMLNEIRSEFDFDIILAHLNHLHRKDAKADEDLVIETAKALNLKCFVERKSMDDYAKSEKISPEDAGRRLRYDFFERIKKDYKSSKIVLAHNIDDLSETIFMRIIRGTGIDGLITMRPKSGDIIRPILNFSKKEILDFLHKENFAYHIDSTNLEVEYTRNKLRLEIIPEIEKINPLFKESLINLSKLCEDEVSIIKEIENDSFFSICVKNEKNIISFDRKAFEEISNPLRARLIRKAIFLLLGEIKDFSRDNIYSFLSLIDKDTGKKIEKDNLVFQKSYKSYDLYLKEKENISQTCFLKEIDKVVFSDYVIETKTIYKGSYEKSKNKNVVFFDKKYLSFPLKIRNRRNGDKILAFKNGKHKKLKDLFIDEKIDKNLRDKIPIVLSSDKIIWIAGLRRCIDIKVTDETDEIIMISMEKLWKEI